LSIMFFSGNIGLEQRRQQKRRHFNAGEFRVRKGCG
jgi:hypothetical protein